MTRFCKDCKYHMLQVVTIPMEVFPYVTSYQKHACIYGKELAPRDLVTGEPVEPHFPSCIESRLIRGCGQEAKWFEPKITHGRP